MQKLHDDSMVAEKEGAKIHENMVDEVVEYIDDSVQAYEYIKNQFSDDDEE